MGVEELVNSTGARVRYGRLPKDWYGAYDAHRHEIIIVRGMGPIHKRCVLTHEAMHATWRDQPTRLTKDHIERRARLLTARFLVDPELLQDLQRWHPDNPERWCHGLGVTPEVLTDYLAVEYTPTALTHP
jgi:Zn-dependent peptidase ImmA (M78 family)